jgi:hypothetical protein
MPLVLKAKIHFWWSWKVSAHRTAVGGSKWGSKNFFCSVRYQNLGLKWSFLPTLVWKSWRFGIDSLTFKLRLFTLPQKSPKESNPPDSIPGFVPTLASCMWHGNQERMMHASTNRTEPRYIGSPRVPEGKVRGTSHQLATSSSMARPLSRLVTIGLLCSWGDILTKMSRKRRPDPLDELLNLVEWHAQSIDEDILRRACKSVKKGQNCALRMVAAILKVNCRIGKVRVIW